MRRAGFLIWCNMSLLPNISTNDYMAIDLHLRGCIESAENTARSFREYAKSDDLGYAKSQLAYWENVAKGLRWSLNWASNRRVEPDVD